MDQYTPRPTNPADSVSTTIGRGSAGLTRRYARTRTRSARGSSRGWNVQSSVTTTGP